MKFPSTILVDKSSVSLTWMEISLVLTVPTATQIVGNDLISHGYQVIKMHGWDSSNFQRKKSASVGSSEYPCSNIKTFLTK